LKKNKQTKNKIINRKKEEKILNEKIKLFENEIVQNEFIHKKIT
jgi:hypothetical protein